MVTEATCELPLYVAVMEAVWFDVTLVEVALKIALIEPAGTMIIEGTVSDALLSDSEMAAPAAGADSVSITVQPVELPEANVDGVHRRVDSVAVDGGGGGGGGGGAPTREIVNAPAGAVKYRTPVASTGAELNPDTAEPFRATV
jgi:hypothetical protein